MDQARYDLVPSDSQIQLRLDHLPRKALFSVYFTAFCLVLGCVFGAFFAPQAFGRLKGTVYRCGEGGVPGKEGGAMGTDGGCVPYSTEFVPKWVGTLDDVSPMNQFFVIYVDVYRDEVLAEASVMTEEAELQLEVSLAGVIDSQESILLLPPTPKPYSILCPPHSPFCGSLFLGYQSYLDYPAYTITLKVSNWSEAGKWLQKLEVTVRAVREQFSTFQITVKYTFFALAVVCSLCYLYQVLTVKVEQWSTETRGLVILSCSVVVFNDPTYFLSVNYPNFALTAVSVLSNVQFVAVLAYFWVEIQLEIQPLRGNCSFRLWLGVYLWVFSLISTFVYLYADMTLKNDPSFHFSDFPPSFLLLISLNLALFIGYFLFFGWLTVRNARIIQNQTKRLQFICKFNVFLAVLTIIGVITGVFQRLPSVGRFVLVVEGVYNVYVALMQVLLAPAGREKREKDVEMRGIIGSKAGNLG